LIKEDNVLYKKIILFLILSSILSISVSADLNVTPESLNVSIDNGYSTKQFVINNTFNYSIDISLSTSLSSPVFFNPTSFSLNYNENKIVTVTFLEGVSQSGKIIITYSNGSSTGTKNVSVNLTILSNSNKNVSIYPVKPYSGKLFVLALKENVDLPGFIFISDEVIPVYFNDGFTTVEVEPALYGDAELWLKGEGFIYDFEILCGIDGTALFEYSKTLTVGDIATISLSIGGEKLKGVSISLIDHDGIIYSFKTDADGNIKPVMDKPGEWIIKTVFKDKQIVSKINVEYKQLKINLDKISYNVGDKTSVSFDENNVDVTVKRDNMIILQQQTETGVLDFFLSEPGTYVVSAIANEKKASKEFIVKSQTVIRILDENNMQTSILRTDKKYIVQVIDNRNNLVSIYDTVSTPYGLIYINNGLGFYTPTEGGQISLSIPDKDNFLGCSVLVTVEQAMEQDNSLLYAVLVIVVIIVIVLFLFFLYQKGMISIPSLPKRRNIPDKIL
jgi:hypothetical protein